MLAPTVLIFVGAFLSVSRSAILVLAVIGARALPQLASAVAAARADARAAGCRWRCGSRSGLVGTILSLFTNLNNDPSVSGRTSDYAVVVDVFEDHPWLGRGLFTFMPRSYRILDNQWLMILVELGVVGLLAFLAFLLTAFFAARSAFRHARHLRSRHLGLVLSSTIAGAAVSMVTYDGWTYRLHSGISFLVIGLAGAAWRLAGRTAREEEEWPGTVQSPKRARLPT